jgi:hypothetical protein
MWRFISEHVERHWGRMVITNLGVVTAAQLAQVESFLKVAVLAATFVLTCLGCYYKVKKNGKDAS